jgi:hypothetical protein
MLTAPLTQAELLILQQEQRIRKEFGEEGVRRFYAKLENDLTKGARP